MIGDLNSQINRARLPSLPGLRCFDTAARFESFSRAADALNLTHGAISRAVRALEDELGVALFERRNRSVFLTDAGRKLALAVRDGFATIEAGLHDLRMDHSQAPLVVSCEPTLLMRWLIPRLPEFQALQPDIVTHFVAGAGPVTLGHGIDLAIRCNDFTWPPELYPDLLLQECVGPVCRPDKVGAFFERDGDGRMRLKPTAPLLHTKTRASAWRDWCVSTDSPGKFFSGQTFDHFYFSLQAAVAGLGVAIGPWLLVRDDIDSGILAAPCDFEADPSTYHLLAPAPIEANTREGKLREWLRQVCL